MSHLPMTFACGLYDRMTALYTGEVRAEGIDLNFIAVNDPRELFDRMVARLEFDASEMSASEYVTRLARGQCPFIALPVFPSRMFRHGFITVDTRAIKSPKDLAGKRIGVQLYTMTAAIWIRGLLQHDLGVDLSTVQWVEGAMEEPTRHGNPTVLPPLKPLSIVANTSGKILEPVAGGGRDPGGDRRRGAERHPPLRARAAPVSGFRRRGESLLPPHQDLSDHASRGVSPGILRAASVRRHQPLQRARAIAGDRAAAHALSRG